jgi:transcriptional regulator with PAS, ATPase and Fis domain
MALKIRYPLQRKSHSTEGWINLLDADGHFRPLAAIQNEVIARALSDHQGDVKAVSSGLRIGKATLYRWLARQR